MSYRIIKSSSLKANLAGSFRYRPLNCDGGSEGEPMADLACEASQQPTQLFLGSGPAQESPRTENALEPEEKIDLAQIEKRAYEEGFRQGEKAAREIGEQQIASVLKRLAESLKEVAKLKRALYQTAEKDVVKLALSIARKIVQREVNIDNNIVLALARAALSYCAERSRIVVHLHPADYEFVAGHKDELMGEAKTEDLVLQPDNNVDRGGCLIETDYGDIDARISEQFQAIERSFLEVLPR